MEPTVTITLEQYKNFLKSELLLDALGAGGVDNWEGYELVFDADYHAEINRINELTEGPSL